jgi:hypothetical protein
VPALEKQNAMSKPYKHTSVLFFGHLSVSPNGLSDFAKMIEMRLMGSVTLVLHLVGIIAAYCCYVPLELYYIMTSRLFPSSCSLW